MSFSVLPDRVVGYATYELAEKLAGLTPQQRAAIDRIVQHVYIENRPLADLLRGDDKIASEQRYYQRGAMDEQTGRWLKRPGWHHDPDFQAALKEAKRLALMVRTREEMTVLANAKRKARLASDDIVDQLLDVARHGEKGNERVAASKVLLDYAGPGDMTTEAETDAEQDWWEAAEHDE